MCARTSIVNRYPRFLNGDASLKSKLNRKLHTRGVPHHRRGEAVNRDLRVGHCSLGSFSERRETDIKTILLVDDEPSVRLVIQESLEDLGYTVLVAEDGMEGLPF